ncbi:thioredoxin fold domain-containing protein [Vibrio alginolyticus]|uniref:thioredoxin family protein n=1 Tax=Vibrio TaxID=662 RepID=UPI00029A87EA|nr:MULTISPECIES: thioredoxin domain-containing protein [Vibrio]ELB2812699.1 thioredoxin fold domain-containing protein [Vibrio alginolyticus]MDA0407375.1 thioredoxin domain-containing protein [Vibrio alginolyticus]OEE24284.1 hypothetical protein OAM_17100 [Vibrio cyclitrophicus ZF14]
MEPKNKDTVTVLNQIPEPYVMLWFSATWCGPCKQIEPVVGMIEQDYVGTVKIIKLDTDEEYEMAQRFGIRSVPSLVLLDRKKHLDTKVGASSYTELTQWLNSHINSII